MFGRNGSGKSTLSAMLACFGGAEEPPTGAMVVAGGASPAVLVFDQAYVDQNVRQTEPHGLSPERLFTLGEADADRAASIVEMTERLEEAEEASKSLTEKVEVNENAQTALISRTQDRVIEVFDGVASPKHLTNRNRYTPTTFDKGRARTLLGRDTADAPAVTESKRELATPDEEAAFPAEPPLMADLAEYERLVKEVLQRVVVNESISALADQPDVERWVRDGLHLHPAEQKTCQFCTAELTEQRRAALESHFNKAFSDLANDLDAALDQTRASVTALTEWKIYVEAVRGHELCQGEPLQLAAETLLSQFEAVEATLTTHSSDLHLRVASPLHHNGATESEPMTIELLAFADPLQIVVSNEAARAANAAQRKVEAEDLLLQAVCNELAPIWKELVTKRAKLRAESESLDLAGKREDLENEQSEQQQGRLRTEVVVAKMNDVMARYFGHDEIQLVDSPAAGTMRIMRGATAAKYLSDGERRGIALIYFLVSTSSHIHDEDSDAYIGDLGSCCFVIDDPVTSFDDDAIYYAVELIFEAFSGAGQLIITTHNQHFLRRMHTRLSPRTGDTADSPGAEVALLYMSKTPAASGCILTVTAPDWLATALHSEYTLAFFDTCASAMSDDDSCRPSAGNTARRLLEAFAKTKAPQTTSLTESLDILSQVAQSVLEQRNTGDNTVEVPVRTSLRALLNPLQELSHGDMFAVQSIRNPAQVRDLCCDVLNLIKVCDDTHFRGMGKVYERCHAIGDWQRLKNAIRSRSSHMVTNEYQAR